MSFYNVGINIEKDADVLKAMNIAPFELDDPLTYAKIKSVLDFFRDKENKDYFLRRIIKNDEKPLERVYRYVMLKNEYDGLQNEFTEVQSKHAEMSTQISLLKEELSSLESL